MRSIALLLLVFQHAFCDSCTYRVFELHLNHTPLRWDQTKPPSTVKQTTVCSSKNQCLVKPSIRDAITEDNVNATIVIVEDRVWLGRDVDEQKYLLCCHTDNNQSKNHEYCNEDMLTAILLRATMKRRIDLDELTAPKKPVPLAFRYYVIGFGCIFGLAVVAHVIACIFFMCSMDRHTPMPAMKEEHDTAALYEQNAALPQLFPTKVPSQIAPSVVKTAIENLSESGKTTGRDETTLIELTASDAQKNMNLKAAQLREDILRNSAAVPSAPTTMPPSSQPEMDRTQSVTPPNSPAQAPTAVSNPPKKDKDPSKATMPRISPVISKLPTKASASSLDKTQSLADTTQIGSSEPLRMRRRQSREAITATKKPK